MKRFLALLLASLMLLAFVACDEETADDNGKNEAPDTEDTASKGDGDEDNKDPETPEHTHSHTSEVTKEKTCTENGIKTFTCSCGDSYTEEIVTEGHSWSYWDTVTPAIIGKAGEEKRTCKTCGSSETRETTENAAMNSFLDRSLAYVGWTGENIHDSSLLSYFSHNYEGRTEETERFPSETVFSYLSERFEITEDKKQSMKNFYYDAASDTFELAYTGEAANFYLLGYVHNGGSSYTLYYEYESFELDENGNSRIHEIWKIDVQYNLLDSKPNKYLAFDKVETTPDGMIECEPIY